MEQEQKIKTWTRKGRCPMCNVSTGSKHSKDCAWRFGSYINKNKQIKCLWCDKLATHKDYREIDGTTTSTRECDECAKLDTAALLAKQK